MPHHHHLLLPRRLLVTPFVSPSVHSSPSLIHEGIFFSFAAVFLAAVVYYVFDYLIVRFFHLSRQQSQPPPDRRDSEREDVLLIELQAIPLKVYHASPPDGGDDGMQDENCPVCLGEYVDGEELRVLPICHHAFHRECIDKWLLFKSSSFSSLSFSSSSTSCPVCRGSILDPEMAAAAVAAEEPAAEVAAEEETNVSV